MDEQPASEPQSPNGLISRLRQRGEQLAQGRRLVLTLPGWDDLGDGRGLWARFKPLTREMQQRFAWTPDVHEQELQVVVPMIVEACEEILVGTADERTPLANEPDVAAQLASIGTGFGPLVFSEELGKLLGIGGDDGAAVVKRMFVRGDDDITLYALWGELLAWSGTVSTQGVEVAAGE